jgi:hypothetical protein
MRRSGPLYPADRAAVGDHRGCRSYGCPAAPAAPGAGAPCPRRFSPAPPEPRGGTMDVRIDRKCGPVHGEGEHARRRLRPQPGNDSTWASAAASSRPCRRPRSMRSSRRRPVSCITHIFASHPHTLGLSHSVDRITVSFVCNQIKAPGSTSNLESTPGRSIWWSPPCRGNDRRSAHSQITAGDAQNCAFGVLQPHSRHRLPTTPNRQLV